MTWRVAFVGVMTVGLIAAFGCATTHYDYAPPPHPHVAHANTQNDEDYQFFYDDLAPYGNWVWIDGPGMVWAPYNVTVGWRPYVEGHWANTDYGWTWASDEPFGWAVYHYGRWHNSANHGWVWVPGRTWGPAWVSWQHGDGWTGWAPLPWRVRWRVGIGLDWGHVHPTHAIQVSAWTFARTGHMVDIHLRNHIAPASRNVTILKVTNNVTHYTYIDNRVINGGVKVKVVQKAAGHPIPRRHIKEAKTSHAVGHRKGHGKDLLIYRPDPSKPRPANVPVRTHGARKKQKSKPAAVKSSPQERTRSRQNDRMRTGRSEAASHGSRNSAKTESPRHHDRPETGRPERHRGRAPSPASRPKTDSSKSPSKQDVSPPPAANGRSHAPRGSAHTRENRKPSAPATPASPSAGSKSSKPSTTGSSSRSKSSSPAATGSSSGSKSSKPVATGGSSGSKSSKAATTGKSSASKSKKSKKSGSDEPEEDDESESEQSGKKSSKKGKSDRGKH